MAEESAQGYCQACDYVVDLDGEPRCPECGVAFDRADPRMQTSRKGRRRSAWRSFLIGIGALALVIVVVFVVILIQLGMYPILGLEAGYYGKYNRIRHAIEDMEGVTIVDQWLHRDLSLEDFGFTVELSDGHLLDLRYHDGTPEKNERDRDAIRRHVQKQIDALE